MRRALVVFAAFSVLLALSPLLLRVVPLPAALFLAPDTSLEILDREGRSLRTERDAREQFSARVSESELPPALIAATLAAEDKRFWNHPGVDARATLRAAWQFARNGRVISGGSTLTQQLIKLAEPRPRTVRTKLIEAAQALRLEQVWDKPRILAEYLNRLDYGNLRAGAAAASGHYFGKPPRDLSPAEAALLAGLPQAPARLNPRTNLERAQRRQRWILGRMRANGALSAEEHGRALAEPLRLAQQRRTFEAPHFVDFVLQGLDASGAPRTGRITTTLDLELNRVAQRALRGQLAQLRGHNAGNGAVVVLDNRNGEVLALVGSEDWFAPDSGQVNGAWAARPAGSALKPFTYALAFERGANPATVIADVPTEFATPTGVFKPENYDRRPHGPVSARVALASSLNIAAVRLLDAHGGPEALKRLLRECGLTTLDRPAEHYGLGLTLGNAGVRLLELANAYACVARGGELKPVRVVSGGVGCVSSVPCSDLQRESWNARLGTRVFSRDTAWLIADILADNDARAPAFGPDSALRFAFPVACKTGTSSDFRDNWAVGFTPEFTVAVWVGNFDGSPMRDVSGVSGAAPVMHAVMEHLHARSGTTAFARPDGIIEIAVHPLTGRRFGGHGAVVEKFSPRAQPGTHDADDFDARGQVRLAAEFGGWFARSPHALHGRAVVRNGTAEPLRVVSPLPGTVFFLDPDLPATSLRIALRATGATGFEWAGDSITCVNDGATAYARMTEGRHTLRVRDPGSGRSAATWVEVRRL